MASIETIEFYNQIEPIDSYDNVILPTHATIQTFINFFNEGLLETPEQIAMRDVNISPLENILWEAMELPLRTRVNNGFRGVIQTHNMFCLLKETPIINYLSLVWEASSGDSVSSYGVHFYEFQYNNTMIHLIVPMFYNYSNPKFTRLDIETLDMIHKIENEPQINSMDSYEDDEENRIEAIYDEILLNLWCKIDTIKIFKDYKKAERYMRTLTDFWHFEKNEFYGDE